MKRRQTMPREWLIADHRLGDALWTAIQKLPRGSGILVLFHGLPRRDRQMLLRRMRVAARSRGLVVVDEQSPRSAARIHDMRELRRALLDRTPLILISPIRATRSHPQWAPIPRMRAAALARLAGRRAIGLGGMNARRFARIAQLGFCGWAAIDGLLPPRA